MADLKKELEGARRSLEEAQARGEYEKAAELQYGKIPSLEKQIAEVEEMQRDESGKETRLLRENVTEEEIAEIISRWTGIPLQNLFKVSVKNY